MGTDTLQLPKKLREGRALITATEQGGKGMLVGIELGESVDAQEGGKQQGLKASPQRRVAVMQEGKVVTGMRRLMGCDRLLELRHNRVQGALLIEPMLKEMHPHIEQTGLEPDDLGAGSRRPRTGSGARAALRPAKLPPPSQAVEMTDTDVKRDMILGHLVEQESTGALRVCMKHVHQYRFVNVIELSTGTTRWT